MNEKHIDWIDYVRSIAIGCVVLCHSIDLGFYLSVEGG